jgi:hypothetical protein
MLFNTFIRPLEKLISKPPSPLASLTGQTKYLSTAGRMAKPQSPHPFCDLDDKSKIYTRKYCLPFFFQMF